MIKLKCDIKFEIPWPFVKYWTDQERASEELQIHLGKSI